MRTPAAWFSWVAIVMMLGAAAPASAQEVLKLGEGETLTISGFINSTLFTDRQRFGGFGQGQNAEWAAQTELKTDKTFADGDIRNTRISFDFKGEPVLGSWAPRGVVETDFFGGQDAPPFGDEQPRVRARLAYADLSNGRTTLRIGQYWSPMFGEVPVSLSHIAFPLGYGSAGMVGWRFPGVYFYRDLVAPGGPASAQLQLAAFKGSGPATPGEDTPAAIGNGEASGLPQLEARLNFGRKTEEVRWALYAVGHVDWKDTSGTGVKGDNLTALGFEAGGNLAPGRLTLHGNYYYGKALGQQFAHITQQGNVRGWGAWGQAGYDFTPNWSLWGFFGIDDPDEAQFPEDNPNLPALQRQLARQVNREVDGMLRFKAGRYALGLEWFRAMTRWNTGLTNADQVSLSVLYTL